MGNLESKEKEQPKQIKLKDILGNVKSKYILQNVFNNLEKKKSFKILKYNKNIKNRMNININDYKKFSELFSSIEIELKPSKDKYGNFINIDKENKIYFHTHFNNIKEEIKRNNINEND